MLMGLLEHAPRFSREAGGSLAEKLYGIRATVFPLPSERDQNFLLTTESGKTFVLKIANALEDRALLEAQNEAMRYLESRVSFCPRILPALSGDDISLVEAPTGSAHLVRLVTYLPGAPLAEIKEHSPELLRDFGKKLGRFDGALAPFDHPAVHRDFYWDLANSLNVIDRYEPLIANAELRAFVSQFAQTFERDITPLLSKLRRSVIHNDANDYNVIVGDEESNRQMVVGLIDFGDMVHSYTIADLAVGIAYVVLDKPDPLAAAEQVATGYHEENPLNDDEIECLYGLVMMRLCMSVCLAAYQHQQQPDNEYLEISQRSITSSLPGLAAIGFHQAAASFRKILKRRRDARSSRETLLTRQRLIGKSVKLAYTNPVKIVRGEMQYLYDENGRQYLDAYNNVAHVGHCHPRVVRAGQQQMALLNTNTRYLHDLINRYAERLTGTLPPSLSVCFFVNSGSEANELALRLARAHTNQRNLIVLDHAYHGNTTTLIDISPYKHEGPGGQGPPSWVHKVPLPDVYRGLYRSVDANAAEKYAQHVVSVISELDGLCAFIAESLPSVAGQIVFPAGYVAKVYQSVREAGGVCIADEVQTGYGRIGTHFWGFESYDVVPDILVLGKPIGNGHPIGAVITTAEIAASFDNGMEFFSTFGGNTVSCAIGLSVLEVVLEENLQQHALGVGEQMLKDLRGLQDSHAIIGDVRGSGFFLGVELVCDRDTLEPATEEAELVVNRLREQAVLVGTDGPFHNVIKIRPPMPFDSNNADRLIGALDEALTH